MIRYNTDCPYCHDIFDQYCNLFKDYKNCDKSDCEVLKTLKENEQLKQQIEEMKNCQNCKLRGAECVALEYQGIRCGKTRDKWELAE